MHVKNFNTKSCLTSSVALVQATLGNAQSKEHQNPRHPNFSFGNLDWKWIVFHPLTTIKCIVYLCLNIFFSTYYSQPYFRLKELDKLMHYMVPLFFCTHNFVIEEVLYYIEELYKFSHKWIKNTLHSFSHGLINFRECPTRVTLQEYVIKG